MRQKLRGLPVFAGPLPAFDIGRVPSSPVDLFVEWLSAALAADVPEAHAMTLSTVDVSGRPDARVLILKDVGDRGWAFASSAASRKGQQLHRHPHAALSAYWPALGRQVRVRGVVHAADTAESAHDFLERSAGARAQALLDRQSQVLTDEVDVAAALAESAARVEGDPRLVAPTWTLYWLVAEEVEFWQASASRRHTRLRYHKTGEQWQRELLWP